MGGIRKMVGWKWKIPLKWIMTGGTPMTLETPKWDHRGKIDNFWKHQKIIRDLPSALFIDIFNLPPRVRQGYSLSGIFSMMCLRNLFSSSNILEQGWTPKFAHRNPLWSIIIFGAFCKCNHSMSHPLSPTRGLHHRIHYARSHLQQLADKLFWPK